MRFVPGILISSCLLFVASHPEAATLTGDIAPRGNSDGVLNVADYLILQRIVLGELEATPGESLVADVAPLGNSDGQLNVGDLVVMMRAIRGQITLPALPDNQPPAQPDISLISVGGSGDVLVSGGAGSVEGGVVLTLTNFETGDVSFANANPDGSFTATLAADSGQVFSVVARDLSGNASPAAALGIGQVLDLDIAGPVQNDVVAGSRVVVSGTYLGPVSAAVVVNGISACMQNNNFFAVVPIAAGTNVITVTVSIPDGLSLSQSVTVSSTGPLPVDIQADSGCGITPHTIGFSFINNSAGSIQLFEVDADSDGIADVTDATGKTRLEYTYATTGNYAATVNVVDDAGQKYSWVQPVYMESPGDVDNKRQTVFNSLLNRLTSGAIDGALNYLTGPMRAKYTDAFTGAKDSLTSVVDQLGTVAGGRFGENWAYYTVIRVEAGQTIGFPLFILRGNDGVWRIGEM